MGSIQNKLFASVTQKLDYHGNCFDFEQKVYDPKLAVIKEDDLKVLDVVSVIALYNQALLTQSQNTEVTFAIPFAPHSFVQSYSKSKIFVANVEANQDLTVNTEFTEIDGQWYGRVFRKPRAN